MVGNLSSPDLRAIGVFFALALLAGCDADGNFNFLDTVFSEAAGEDDATRSQLPDGARAEYTEEDVEAPEVFSAKEDALWDGRPSLGGVWVAHPEVREPERVMIRNQSNGKFVVGALFRREREIPGPRLQLSSDAAIALDVLAGAPVELEVVALRKERIPVEVPEPVIAETDGPGDAAEAIEQTPLEAAAVTADGATRTEAAAPEPEGQPVIVQSTLPVSRLEKPYIQVGIFNRAPNAETAADQMRAAGLTPTVLKQDSGGKAFWRVIVGPAGTTGERRALQDTVRGIGYTDAYPVTN